MSDDPNAPPTAQEPLTVQELIDQQREQQAGTRVARMHRLARKYAPDARNKFVELLDKQTDKSKGIIKDALRFVREKTAGPRQVCTDAELREIDALYRKLQEHSNQGLIFVNILPSKAMSLAEEAYELAVRILLAHPPTDDPPCEGALPELELLMSLAEDFFEQALEWYIQNRYIVDKAEHRRNGKPNLIAEGMLVGIPDNLKRAGETYNLRDKHGNQVTVDSEGNPIPTKPSGG